MVAPLSADQAGAVAALERAGSIEAVPADATRASAFLRKARIKCEDIANIQHPENRFDLGYGACHDVGEALLSAYGYRTRSGAGQHIAIGLFLAAVIDEPPGSVAARRYDRLRRIRNNQDYRAQPVSEVEATLATQSAQLLLAAVGEKGIT